MTILSSPILFRFIYNKLRRAKRCFHRDDCYKRVAKRNEIRALLREYG